MSSMIGKRLGDYEIIEEIGEGAMGKVYLARNTLQPAIQVVLKILKDTQQKKRFLAEAKTLARLGHENICQLRHFFHSEDELILAMEYIDGKSLADLSEEWDEIDLGRAKSIIIQVLDGLDHAHRMGVYHRDIKLSNIMVDKHGVAKIIDFGIARHTQDPRYTGTGMSVGTPQFMAPEQFTEERIDDYSLCDIYSVGICLYQLCCGRLPFEDTNPFILKEKHCLEPPPSPSSLNNDIYFSLEKMILKAIAKDPLDRFNTAAEMRDELARAARGLDPLSETFKKPTTTITPEHPIPRERPVIPAPPVVSHGRVKPTELIKPQKLAQKRPPADTEPGIKRPAVARSQRRSWWLYAAVAVLGCFAIYTIYQNEIGNNPTFSESRGITDTDPAQPADSQENKLPVDSNVIQIPAESVVDQLSPPRLDMPRAFYTYFDSPIQFEATIELDGEGDSLLAFAYHPSNGITARRVSPTKYEITFDPFSGCPSSYAVMFMAEGRGGSDTGRVRFSIQERKRNIHLTVTPPSYLLTEGKLMTENPVGNFEMNIDPAIRKITVMNPLYPLTDILIDTAAATFRQSVDLDEVYSRTEVVELKMNIVGGGNLISGAESPILINGGSSCNLKEWCRFPAGRYLIQPVPDLSLTWNSVLFNGDINIDDISIFKLRTPAEGVRFNTLVFYTH